MKFDNLSKQYGDLLIFKQVNIELPSTGLIILSGPSGSGKSTLLNMIAVFDTDYVGKITHLNQAISTDAIGFIYQDFNLISKLSVYDNVRLSGVHDHDIIVDTLTDLGILDLMNQDADTCAGGEKQRVAIARALIRNPQIILADEPTGSLDHENSENIMTLLKNISKDRLVIVSSHEPAHLSIADHIITFDNESLVHTSKYETQAIPSTFTLRPFESNLAGYAKITKKIRRKTTVLLSLLVMVSSIVLLLSINTQNLFNQSIKSFQDKNHQYRSFFTYYDDDLLINLERNDFIEISYPQSIINDLKLSQGKTDVIVKEKYPFALTDEHLVFGQMPRLNQQEIALSPSLAKSFSQNPVDLIGTSILFNGMSYTVSGIFNYTYDNFILSPDAEKVFYKSNPEKTPFSITGYVTSMGDIQNLIETYPDVKFETAEAEISTFMSTFARIKNIFTIIAVIVLLASIYTLASVILKLQAVRKDEILLLKHLSYSRREIQGLLKNDLIHLMLQSSTYILVTVLIMNTISYAIQNSGLIPIPAFIGITLLMNLVLYIIYTVTGRKSLDSY